MKLSSLLLLFAVVTVPACNRSSGGALVFIQSLGALVPDPTRERVYLSDSVGGRLIALSARTGAVEFERPFGTTLGGIALDLCGEFLYLAVPGSSRILILDADDFTDFGRIDLDRRPFDLSMHKKGLLAVTRGGLVRIDPVTKESIVLVEDVADTDQVLAARFTDDVYLGQTLNGDSRVLRIRITDSGEGEVLAALDLEGEMIDLALSFDDTQVFVGTRSRKGIRVLNSETLEVEREIPTGERLKAFTVNATSTRLYLNTGGLTVEEINLFNLGRGQTVVTPFEVNANGLALSGDQLQLVTHLSDGDVDLSPLFETTLMGAGQVHLHEVYPLVVSGEPGQFVYVFASIAPGYFFIDPADSVEPRFLDLLTSELRVILLVQLDASGEQKFEFKFDDQSLEGARVVVQAVSVDLSVSAIGEVSNPFVGTILPPECTD